MKMRFFQCFGFLLLTAICFCQDPFYINYTIDDGLPSNEVYDVEIDNDGVIWFTTDRGVSSYDSYEFTNYTTFDGLQDNVNFEIFKDSEGVLWFFGFNRNVSQLENGLFKPYQYNNELKSILISQEANYIKEIRESSNKVLHLTANSQNSNNIISITKNTKPSIHNSETVSNNSIDSSSFIFLTNPVIKGKLNTYSVINNIPNSIFHKIKSYRFEFITKTRNSIWYSIQNTKGLFHIDLKNNSFTSILKEFQVTNLKVDYNDNYWITTVNKGIIYIPNIYVTLPTIRSSNNSKMNYIKLHAYNDMLICGTSQSSIIVFDALKNNKEIKINLLGTNQYVDEIQTIESGTKLKIENAYFLEKKGELIAEKKKTRRVSFLTSDEYKIYTTSDGFLAMNKSKTDSLHIRLNEKSTSVAEDLDSIIWIGTLNELYSIDNSDFSNPKTIRTLKGNNIGRVNNITIDSKNNKWISTIGNGIFMINSRDTIHFNTSNSLTTNIVNTVEVTDTNNIWVGTNNGLNLLHYNPSDNSIQFVESFDKSDGLNTSYINDIIQWKENIYIASPNGICTFPPDKIQKKSTEVPLKINSTYVNDSLILQKDLKDLSFNQNQITIQFRAIRHSRSENQKLYKYKLERNSEKRDWIFTNDTEAIYDNLRYGDYTFSVNAANKIGEWNKNAEKLKFTIRPHFTDTTWFKALILIGSIIITLLTSLYFIRRYKKTKATELELEEVKRKSKEAELSALRNQMNPHFIFNSLNTIQNFVFKKDVKKANFLLTKFSSLIRRSLNYSRLESISLQEELQFLTDYVELEKVRFPDLISLQFKIDNSIDSSTERIPTLLLQPLVENSIKHGISKSNRPGIIQIDFTTLNNDYLQIIISDIGMNLKSKNKTSSSHISLGQQIIKDRIEVLRQNGFPNSLFTVNNVIDQVNCNYQVKLILPKL